MIRQYGGNELAKVLLYYGLVEGINSSEFNIVCPFHDDINPSMKISLNDGSFFCFGCEVKGNALDFVQAVHSELNDLQACIILEQILNSEEVKALNVKYKKKKKKFRKQALYEAYDYYYGLKQNDWNNIKTEEEQKVIEYMKNRGFNARALNIAGCKTNYNIAYPFIFPILDNGKFMGWVGRTMNNHVEKKRKYFYNEGFRKRITLCGNYEENKIVYICEGFMDYLSLRTRGHIKNVVAILGWHISDEQVAKLKDKGITTIVSALDNDKAGNKGTRYLKRFFNVVRFQYPEDKKDVGEMTETELKTAIEKTRRILRNGIKNSNYNGNVINPQK